MGFCLYQVPMVEQGPNPICWVACAAMILSWKKQASVSIGDLIGSDPSNSCVLNPGGGTFPALRTYLEGWGFVCEAAALTPTGDYVEQRLQAHGPLLFVHQTEGFPYDARFPPYTCSPLIGPGQHAIVITGMNTDDNTCAFKNPWGSVGVVGVQIVLDAIVDIEQVANSFPFAYLP